MELRNESVGYPMGGFGGYGGCGFGGGFGIELLAILALFRNNFNNGDFGGAQANLGFIENALGNIRADIGDVKYDTVSSILQSTNALMVELCNGKLENIEAIMNQTNALQGAIHGIEREMCAGFNHLGAQISETKYDLGRQISDGTNFTNMNILKQGYENQLANCQQTNILSRQAADCCCDLKGLVSGTAFQTQLRDLENQNCTNQQLAEIKCLIKETAKDQEIERLRRAEQQGFIANQVNRGITATIGHWTADAQFNGVTYPQPSFPWTSTIY